MSVKILETENAINDAIAIAEYIADHQGLDASDRFLDAVKEGYRFLAAMPGAGAPRDYGNPAYEGLRVWPVPRFRQYLIFYVPSEEVLEIIRVLHGARDIDAIFAPEE